MGTEDTGVALAIRLSACQQQDHALAVSLLVAITNPDVLRAAEAVLVASDQPVAWVQGRRLALELDGMDADDQRATVRAYADLRVLRAAQATLAPHEGDERLAGWIAVRIATLDAARHVALVEEGAISPPKTKAEKKREAAASHAMQHTLFPTARAGLEPFAGLYV